MKKLRNAQLTELPQTVEIERKKLSTEATLVKGSMNYCELYLNRRTNFIITSAQSKETERLRERLLDFNSALAKSVDLSQSSSIIVNYTYFYFLLSTASSEERTRRQPVVNRPQQPAAVNKTCWLASTDIKCDPNSAYRTIDGSCNNLKHPTWGQSIRPMARLLSPLYEPGN